MPEEPISAQGPGEGRPRGSGQTRFAPVVAHAGQLTWSCFATLWVISLTGVTFDTISWQYTCKFRC